MQDKRELKTLVASVYDTQKLRIEMGNRIVGNFKARLGQDPEGPESDIDEEGSSFINELRKAHRRITDSIIEADERVTKTTFKGNEVITSYLEYCLIQNYVDILAIENNHFKSIKLEVGEHEIYKQFLSEVKGCGEAMSAVIITGVDIEKCKYASSLWSYAGLDVAKDGRGRSMRKEHLVDRKYLDKNKEEKTKKSITFNPFLKSKLLGVLGPCFLRSVSPYREHYDNYKHRIENNPAHAEKTKMHRHKMAMRYMVKIFLADLYAEWRKIEGLEVHPPYHEAKLGMKHGR